MSPTDEQAGAWTEAFESGKFIRKSSEFRDRIAEGELFDVETGRYHLYISHACPWAHRTLITRKVLGLENHISVDVVDWRMNSDGSWSFNPEEEGATADTINGESSLEGVYNRAFSGWSESRRIGTVPVLWDRQQSTIVNNESREIIRMFDAFGSAGMGNGTSLCPIELRDEIDAMIDSNYEPVNNGVYKSGFATTQAAYDKAVVPLFESLEWLEARLGEGRYLMGDRLTEADWRLWTTLVRFDAVYHLHFKCNKKRILDYPNLWDFTRELFQIDGIAETTNMNHIVRHYHYSHETINPNRIIPINPDLDFMAPHNRG